MVQIRSVPDGVHRSPKMRALKAGMSLSDFLLTEITQVADRPSIEEVVERLRARAPVSIRRSSSIDSARLVRELRQGRS